MNERQLKSVKWFNEPHSGPYSEPEAAPMIFETSPVVGTSLKMRLVQRPQMTTLALPRSHTWPSDLLPPHQAPFHFLPDVYSFARFMLATPAYLISDLTRDLDRLESERQTLRSINDALGVMFIDAADRKVREQMAKVAAIETPILKEEMEKAHRDQQEISEKFASRVQRMNSETIHSAGSNPEAPREFLVLRSESSVPYATQPDTSRTHPRNQPRQRRNLNPPPPSTSTYYYYQAASGLPIFLHPLDIRILLSHFHNYSSFPDTITVQVEFVSESTVNDDLRKRCKYLAHMPEGADVVFLETNLVDVVGSEGIKNFEGGLKMRTAKRREKERKEEKARIKALAEERERLEASSSGWARSEQTAVLADEHAIKEDFTALEDANLLPQPSSPSTAAIPASPTPVSGAWGMRSFASALHSSAPAPASLSSSRSTEEDEWDLDIAWHELEQRNGGAGRRKRANKLVVLGSGGGGARRR